MVSCAPAGSAGVLDDEAAGSRARRLPALASAFRPRYP